MQSGLLLFLRAMQGGVLAKTVPDEGMLPWKEKAPTHISSSSHPPASMRGRRYYYYIYMFNYTAAYIIYYTRK